MAKKDSILPAPDDLPDPKRRIKPPRGKGPSSCKSNALPLPKFAPPTQDEIDAANLARARVERELASAATAQKSFATAHEVHQARQLLAEFARRKVEALRLYEPLPMQAAFHASHAPERLLRGSNRGGKTLPAAVEVARAVCGMDPHGKWPRANGRFFVVGKNLDHCGSVMWRKLSRAEAFRMIRDEYTGAWRAFRPWDAADLARKAEARWAPPLIPPRMIAGISWVEKKSSIPKQVRLVNGWELSFYSSEGEPPQGADLDGVWFDEEIEHGEWYPEMAARLLDRSGKFLWSATPQAGTEVLFELHERAERCVLDTPAPIQEFIILLADNPHLSQADKDLLISKIKEEDRRVRVDGEFAITSHRIYPEYSRAMHGVAYFQVPHDWTLYAVIDPGRQVCAVLFGARPPKEVGDYVYLFDELYIANCDAAQFGQRMKEKTQGMQFQAFVIDHQGGRHHDAGSGRTIEDQYSEALRKNGVASVETGPGFIWGADDVAAGVEASRALLLNRPDVGPKLRAMWEKLPNFEYEIKRYRYQKLRGVLTDKPEARGQVHLMACLRYLAMHGARYVPPTPRKAPLTGAVAVFRQREKRRREKDGGKYVRLG